MKQQIIRTVGPRQMSYLQSLVAQDPCDGSREWVCRNARVSKTLAQLGALFGLWIEEIMRVTGEDKDAVHRDLKLKFLTRIYAENPIGDIQEMWSERYWHLMELCDQEKLAEHLLRASLSDKWGITKEQMSAYMTDVRAWALNNGIALSVPDRFHRYYREAA